MDKEINTDNKPKEEEELKENQVIDKIKLEWDMITKSAIIHDHNIANKFRMEYNIYTEAIGTPITSRRQNKLLSSPFLLDEYSSIYLSEKY